MRDGKGRKTAFWGAFGALVLTIITITNTQTWEQIQANAFLQAVIYVLTALRDVFVEMFSIGWARVGFWLFFCAFLYGLWQLIYDNLLIKVFQPKLISREKKLINEKKYLDSEVLRIKGLYDSREEEITQEKITLLTNLESSDIDADRAYKQLEQSKEKLKKYEPTSEPTFQKLIIHNGEWEYSDDNNIASCQIVACKKDDYRPDSVYIDRPTINPLTKKPFTRELDPIDPNIEMMTYIISVSFEKLLHAKPSGNHKFRERLPDGSLGEELPLKTSTIISNHRVQVLYTVTSASGEFHLKFQ